MSEINDWPDELREPFLDHILADDGSAALAEHIRSGGTIAAYASQWIVARVAAAVADERSEHEAAVLALTLPVPEWGTVRDYLVELLAALWGSPTTYREASVKYGMTGESDWRYDLYRPLSAAGLIPAWKDGYGIGYRLDGTRHPEDQARADAIILAAIRNLAAGPPTLP
jgi:hypothetical protein